MRAPFLFFLSVFLSVPGSTRTLSSSLQKYIEAKNLENFQTDKSCTLYQELARNEKFVLRDLAWLKQNLICSTPLSEPGPELSGKPWLSNLSLVVEEKKTQLAGDALAFTEVRGRLARAQKGQKAGLAILDETAKDLPKLPGITDDALKAAEKRLIEIKQDYAPRFRSSPKPEEQLKVAQDFLSAREFTKARSMAQQVIKRKSSNFDEVLAARRLYRTSFKIENKKDSFLKALDSDWKWAEKQKRARIAADLGLIYARALWTENQAGKARTVLTAIEKKHAANLRLNEIPFIRGKMLEENQKWKDAIAEYQKATIDLKFPQDKKLQFSKAWSAIKQKDHVKAIEFLEPLIALGQDDPFESSRGLYWKARAERALGKIEASLSTFKQLQAQDPVGFYGTISYAELKMEFPSLRVPELDSEFQNSPLYDAPYFQALYDVGELEILQAASQEIIRKVKPEMPPEEWLPVFLAAAKANSYLPLFSQISILTPENRQTLLNRDPELLFPLDYKDTILSSAKKFGVPAEYILAIIRQESAFDPFARSPADAMGLMQLLPSVANRYEKETSVSMDHFEDLYKPEFNIPFGTVLLRDLLKKYDRRLFLAAAAYNASERALANWLKSRWNNDVVEFVEEIPYEETRAYVKLIVRNCVFYTRLLNSGKTTTFPKTCLETAQVATN